MTRAALFAALFVAGLVASASAQEATCKAFTTTEGNLMSDRPGQWAIINVDDEFKVDKMWVSVSVEAKRLGTMKMTLVASTSDGESFKRVTLVGRKGGMSSKMVDTQFSDFSALAFPEDPAMEPFTGVYQPAMKLNRLVMGDSMLASEGGSKGSWILEFQDVVDGGENRASATKINSFTLNLCPEGAPMPAMPAAYGAATEEPADAAEQVEAFTRDEPAIGGLLSGLGGLGLLGGLGDKPSKGDKIAGAVTGAVGFGNKVVDTAQGIKNGVVDGMQAKKEAKTGAVLSGIAALLEGLNTKKETGAAIKGGVKGFVKGTTDDRVDTITTIIDAIRGKSAGVLDAVFDKKIDTVEGIGAATNAAVAAYDAKWDSVLGKLGIDMKGLDEAGKLKVKLLKTMLTATMLKAIMPPPYGALTPLKKLIGLQAGIGFSTLEGHVPAIPPPIPTVPPVVVHHITLVFPNKAWADLEGDSAAQAAFADAFCTTLEIHSGEYMNSLVPPAYGSSAIPRGCKVHSLSPYTTVNVDGTHVVASLTHLGDPTLGLPFYNYIEMPVFTCSVFSGWDITRTMIELGTDPSYYPTHPSEINWKNNFGDPTNCDHIKVMNHYVWNGVGVAPELTGTHKATVSVDEGTTCHESKELTSYHGWYSEHFHSCSGSHTSNYEGKTVVYVPITTWCAGHKTGGHLAYVVHSDYYDTYALSADTRIKADDNLVPKGGWFVCVAWRKNAEEEITETILDMVAVDAHNDRFTHECKDKIISHEMGHDEAPIAATTLGLKKLLPGVLPLGIAPFGFAPPPLPFAPFNQYCTIPSLPTMPTIPTMPNFGSGFGSGFPDFPGFPGGFGSGFGSGGYGGGGYESYEAGAEA